MGTPGLAEDRGTELKIGQSTENSILNVVMFLASYTTQAPNTGRKSKEPCLGKLTIQDKRPRNSDIRASPRKHQSDYPTVKTMVGTELSIGFSVPHFKI